MAFSLDNISVLNVGNVFYRCIFINISKNKGLKRLNIASNLGKRGIAKLDFNPNKTPAQILKEGAFGDKYFREIYSRVNEKWYKNSRKEFIQLKSIDAKFLASDQYDVNANKYGIKTRISLRFWENKGWICEVDPYGQFQCYFRYWLGRRSEDDASQINRWKKL